MFVVPNEKETLLLSPAIALYKGFGESLKLDGTKMGTAEIKQFLVPVYPILPCFECEFSALVESSTIL